MPPGISTRGIAAIVQLERTRLWPGATHEALQAWTQFLREPVRPYQLDGLDVEPIGDSYDFFRVEKMSFAKVRSNGRLESDRSSIVYNSRITIKGIPELAYGYQIGSRSAVEWIIDRYQLRTDKDSRIVNDPNDWSREVGNPRYILDLLARVVTVSVDTMKVVDSLPPLRLRA